MEIEFFPVENKSGNVVVEWQTKNAKTCTLDKQNVDVNGTKKYTLSKKQNIYLKCLDKNNNSITQKLTIDKGITVGKIPTMTASISKVSYKAGEDVEIKIQTENAEVCSVNKISAPTNGKYLVKAKTINEKFVVSCENKGKKVTKNLGAGMKGDQDGVVSFGASQYGNNLKVNCVNKQEEFDQNSKRLFGSQQKGTGPCEGNVYISWKVHDVKSCTMSGPGFKDKNAKIFGGENITVLNNGQDFRLSCIKNDDLVFEKELKVSPLRVDSEELDLSIKSDKKHYLPGEILKLTLEAKNNTGREVFYFNSFPCTFMSPFDLYVNEKNYEEVFGEQKNICKNKSENLDFSYVPIGGTITREINFEIPKNIDEGNKKIRLFFAKNLYGIYGVPNDLDIFIGKKSTSNEISITDRKISLSFKVDKKVYQKGDTMVVSVKYKNETPYSIDFTKINCLRYDGNLILVNGVDFYDYFNSYRQQTCKSPRKTEYSLKSGEEMVDIYGATIDPKKTYPKDDIRIQVQYERTAYVDKGFEAFFKIVDNGTTVSLESDGKPLVNKDYKISWINGLYGAAQGVFLELVKVDATSKQENIVGTIKKIPEGNTYYTPNGEYIWNIKDTIINSNSSSTCIGSTVDGSCLVKLENDVDYRVKASFFDNRLACFSGNCSVNILPKILGTASSETFKVVNINKNSLSSSNLQLIVKLEKYVKIKISGDSCSQVDLNWGDGKTEKVSLVKNSATGICEASITNTYSSLGSKTIIVSDSQGKTSQIVVNID